MPRLRSFTTDSSSYTVRSCLPDPARLAVPNRPGFVSAASRPARRLPDQTALSSHPAAATAWRGGLAPPSIPSASRRTGASWRTVVTFRTHELRLDRVPSIPRGRRCPHDRCMSPAAACRFSAASPCHPGLRPAPGCVSHEASAKVHCRSPQPAFPSPVAPGGTGPSGFSLSFAPGRAGPCHAHQGGDGLWALPGLRPWHQPASFDVLTQYVRQRVATCPIRAQSGLSNGTPNRACAGQQP